MASGNVARYSSHPRATCAPVSTFFLAVAVFVTLTGLYIWVQRRARSIREQAEKREQSAMALMLAGGKSDEERSEEDRNVAYSVERTKPKIVGRLLEDDPAEKAAAAARHAAMREGNVPKSPDLPPIEYGHTQPHRDSKSRRQSSHGSKNGAAHLTPAEQAAADLDPIEQLISQIMVHEPEQRSVTRSAPAPAPASVEPRDDRKRDVISPGVPLRELVLAWYESRGYRGSPASPAVWPIELVLRHRQDAARAYAFVVQNDHVSVDRITALIEQAREIGMMRVAVIAEAGYERGAKEIAKRRNVRLIDRSTMEAELSELQLPTAAKIIAVARTRSAAEPSAA